MPTYSIFTRQYFADRLNHYRSLKGISQSELARKIGVTPTTIWAYEAGDRDPKCSTYSDLANVLGIDPIQFFTTDQTLALLLQSDDYFASKSTNLSGGRNAIINSINEDLLTLSDEDLKALKVIVHSMASSNNGAVIE